MLIPGFKNRAALLVGGILLSSLLAACAGGGPSPVPSGGQEPNTTSPAAATAQGLRSTETSLAASGIRIAAADRAAVATAKTRIGHMYFPYNKYWSKSSAAAAKPASAVFPADLQYFGGALVTSAKIFNAYVDSSPGEAGPVVEFEENFNASHMIHMADEYVHSTANNRYPFGGNVTVNYPAVRNLGDNDLLLILHSVASAIGPGGYHHIYHIFLPSNIHYCSTGTLLPAGSCDAGGPNPAFCAFHDSVVFSDIGETLFSLEPHLPLSLCNIDAFTSNPNQSTPNGPQFDSNFSALSHEQMETLTDPDPGTGWVNPNPFYPSEIGDLCAYLTGPWVNGFVSPENTNLNGHPYRIQFEYSNKQHGCNNSPP